MPRYLTERPPPWLVSHGALLGQFPYLVKAVPLIVFLVFAGNKIAGRPGAIISAAVGIATAVAMMTERTTDAKATAAEWIIGLGVGAMLIADFPAGQPAPEQTAAMSPHGALIVGMVAAIIAGVVAARRVGDLRPWLACIGTGVFMTFVVSKVPGSPIACLAHHQACDKGHQMAWVCSLCFLVPLGVACGIKMVRGDGRR